MPTLRPHRRSASTAFTPVVGAAAGVLFLGTFVAIPSGCSSAPWSAPAGDDGGPSLPTSDDGGGSPGQNQPPDDGGAAQDGGGPHHDGGTQEGGSSIGSDASRDSSPDAHGPFSPPGTVTLVSNCNGDATHDTSVVTAAGAAAGAGNTVQFADGQTCVLNSLTLTAGVYYYVAAGQTATWQAAAVGDAITLADDVTLNGLSTCNEILAADSTSKATIGNCNIGSPTCTSNGGITLGSSSGLTIINNDLSNMSGSVTGYSPTALTIDGNHFDVCNPIDCIDLPNGAGDGSAIRRNVFQHTYLAVMEIGYGATTEATTHLLLDGNWSIDNLAPAMSANGFSYRLAYSIPLNGQGSTGNVISNNYAQGTTPTGNGDICIEISGAATVKDNQCDGFNFGTIGYNTGGMCQALETFVDNDFSGTTYGTVVSYLNCDSSVFQVSGTTTNLEPPPAQPTRIPWGGRN